MAKIDINKPINNVFFNGNKVPIKGGDIVVPSAEEMYNNLRPSDWLVMPKDEDVNEHEYYALILLNPGTTISTPYQIPVGAKIELGTTDNNGVFIADDTKTIVATQTSASVVINADDWGNTTSDGKKQIMLKISHDTDLRTAKITRSDSVGIQREIPVYEIKINAPNLNGTLWDSNSSSSFNRSIMTSLRFFSALNWTRLSSINNMFAGIVALEVIRKFEVNVQFSQIAYLCNYCYNLKAVNARFKGQAHTSNSMFYNCSSLETAELDFDEEMGLDSARRMFYNCYNLKKVSLFNTSAVTSLYETFYNCKALRSIPDCDFSKVTDMYYAFFQSGIQSLNIRLPEVTSALRFCSNCPDLQSVKIEASAKLKSIEHAFSYCYNLEKVTIDDASAITNMLYAFTNCYNLKEFNFNNLSSLDTAQAAFYMCSSLDGVLDFGGAKPTGSQSNIFWDCVNLKDIINLNLSQATSLNSTFCDCFSLRQNKLLEVDSSQATSLSSAFSGLSVDTLKFYIDSLSGTSYPFQGARVFINKLLMVSKTGETPATTIGFQSYVSSLSKEALVELFENLPTATNGCTLSYVSKNIGYGSLTDAEKAIATDKGYVLT